MNIVSKVTVKHLKQNKKRTVVTILGIMLAVALITAISAFAESFLDLMRRGTIAEEGEWHVSFSDVEKKAFPEIEGDKRVDTALVSKRIGEAKLDGCENKEKPYLLIWAYDDAAMKGYPTELVEGRYPENGKEIVLPEHLRTNGGVDWKVGDTIRVDVGRRFDLDENGEEREIPESYGLAPNETIKGAKTCTYTVVGIVERPSFESYGQASYTAFTYLDKDALDGAETFNVAVKLKKLDKSLYEWGNQLAQSLGVENSFHTSLLSYYLLSGNNAIVGMLNTVKWVMMLIVAGGAVAVIYSSFSISISERSRYLGMLASVGATRKQKRDSVFTEAAILGVIGIPLGLLLGFAGVFVTTRCIRGIMASVFYLDHTTMRVIVSWPVIWGAVVLAAVTIFVSAWIPALRASRITPVEAIRQNREIKLNAKQVKTSKLTRKLFGFEGELALKNLKRNKKRYRATVISLVFCIALYLSVASFTAYLKGAYRMAMGMDSANLPDIEVNFYEENGAEGKTEAEWVQEFEEQTEKILRLDGIAGSNATMATGFTFYLSDGSSLRESVRKEMENNGDAVINGRNVGKYEILVDVKGMDEKSLSEYAKKTGADEAILQDKDKIGVILVDKRMNEKDGKRSWKKTFNLEKGDILSGVYEKVTNAETDSEGVTEEMDFSLAGVTGDLPLGGGYSADINHVLMYTTVENAVKIEHAVYGEDSVWNGGETICLKADDHDGLLRELEEMMEEENSGSDSSYRMHAYSIKREVKQLN